MIGSYTEPSRSGIGWPTLDFKNFFKELSISNLSTSLAEVKRIPVPSPLVRKSLYSFLPHLTTPRLHRDFSSESDESFFVWLVFTEELESLLYHTASTIIHVAIATIIMPITITATINHLLAVDLFSIKPPFRLCFDCIWWIICRQRIVTIDIFMI